MEGKLAGKVLWFNQTKGYGELSDEFGNRAFFTQSDCDGWMPGLFLTGQAVTFIKSAGTLFGKARVSAIALAGKKSKSKSQQVRRNEASV